ncbi:MAG: hypothetical protein AAF899_04530 [Pseudomonadota bacterium]
MIALHRTAIALMLAALFSTLADPAAAQGGACAGLRITLSQSSIGAYDARENAALRLPVRLEAGDVPDACTDPDIILRPAGGGRLSYAGASGTLDGRFVRDGGVRGNRTRAQLAPFLAERLLTDGAIDVDLGQVNTGQFVPPGLYRSELLIEVDGAVRGTADLAVDVAAVIAFARGTSSAAQTLDFGVLEPGRTVRTAFFFRSNASVQVTAISENRGRLVNDENPTLSPIPYSADLNGRDLPLSAPVPVPSGNAPGQRVARGNLRLRIGAFDGAWAGTYRDVLVLELRAF